MLLFTSINAAKIVNSLDVKLNNLSYPDCFVKVLWQDITSNINPIWHWSEDLEIVKKTEENT